MSLSPDQLADRLVARLVAYEELAPLLTLDAGEPTIVLPDATKPKERDWANAHFDAMRGALVRAKRYTPGSLDALYGITPIGTEGRK